MIRLGAINIMIEFEPNRGEFIIDSEGMKKEEGGSKLVSCN